MTEDEILEEEYYNELFQELYEAEIEDFFER